MKTLTPPPRIRLPRIATRLPVKTHPDTEALIAESGAWARRNLRSFYPGDHQLDEVERYQVPRLVCLISPGLDREMVLFACNLYLYLTALDDEFANPQGLGGDPQAARAYVQSFTNDLVGQAEPSPRHPFIDEWRQLRSRLPATRWKRLVSTLTSGLSGHLSDLKTLHAGGDTSPTLSEFLDRHRASVAMHPWFVLAEDAFAPQLPDAFATGSELATLIDITLDYMRLTSDLYPYPKEVHGGDVINAIEYFQRVEGLSLQGAVDRLGTAIEACEEDFIRHRDALLARDLTHLPGLGTYLGELGYFLSGTLRWCQLSGRYHGSAPTWDGLAPDAPPDSPRPHRLHNRHQAAERP